MRFLLTILSFFISAVLKAQVILMMGKSPVPSALSVPVVVAQFNLSSVTQTISDWVTVFGDPNVSVLTGTDSRSGSPVTISSVNSTDMAYWNPFSTNSSNQSLSGSGHVLPTGLYTGYWFQFTSAYTPGKEQIEIGGLNPSKPHKIEILSSRQGASDGRKSRIYCIGNGTSTSVLTSNSATYNGDFNAVFLNVMPNSSGIIKIALEPEVPGSTNDQTRFSYANAIKVTQL